MSKRCTGCGGPVDSAPASNSRPAVCQSCAMGLHRTAPKLVITTITIEKGIS